MEETDLICVHLWIVSVQNKTPFGFATNERRNAGSVSCVLALRIIVVEPKNVHKANGDNTGRAFSLAMLSLGKCLHLPASGPNLTRLQKFYAQLD